MKSSPKALKKAREIKKLWEESKRQKAEMTHNLCQWCGEYGTLNDPCNPLIGHHIIKRRFGMHTIENCFLTHTLHCHQEADRVELDYPDKGEVGIKYKEE